MRDHGFRWRCFVRDDYFTNGISLFIAQDVFQPGAPCKVKIWELSKFTEVEEGHEGWPKPTISGPKPVVQPFLQAIVDEAWRYGVRPQALDQAAHESLQRDAHLNDMRAIVAKQLKVILP
jgi:hypothetical protein